MGKGALIAVAMSIMMLSFANSTREESAMNSALVDADYQDEVVSREAAQSAFNIAISLVKADFENYRGSVTDKNFGAASYEYSAVEGDTPEEVIVTAKGMLHNHEFEIVGVIKKSEYRILDAITLDALLYESKNKLEINISNKALISGIDTNPDGSSGPNAPVYGLLVTSEESYQSVKTGTGSSKMIGKSIKNSSINKSLKEGSAPTNLDDIAQGILDYSGAGLSKLGGNQTWTGSTEIGSAANPVVMRINGDVTISDDVVGHGILFVNGDFTMSDNSLWHGLIYRYKDGGKFQMEGNAKLYGAAVARSITNLGSGTNSGDPMEMYMYDDAQILYSSMMLQRMAMMVPELAQKEEDIWTVERQTETPERTGWVLSLREMEMYSEKQDEYQADMLLRDQTSLYDQIKLKAIEDSKYDNDVVVETEPDVQTNGNKKK